jgi:HrpA-like RNA helicase
MLLTKPVTFRHPSVSATLLKLKGGGAQSSKRKRVDSAAGLVVVVRILTPNRSPNLITLTLTRKPTSSSCPQNDSQNDAADTKQTRTNVVDRNSLPIWACRDEIVETVRRNRTVIVVGETGSGKTTQLPQFLLDAGLNKRKGGKRGKIAITQPRRVAAMSVAERVAQERGCELGGEVGYSVRFNDNTTASTTLKFVTDGMLLREAMVSRKRRSSAGGTATTTDTEQQQADDYRAMLESLSSILSSLLPF